MQYVRDHVLLRTETATNSVKDYGVNKAVENLPELREKLSAINDNYQNVQQDILETFIDRGAHDQFRAGSLEAVEVHLHQTLNHRLLGAKNARHIGREWAPSSPNSWARLAKKAILAL